MNDINTFIADKLLLFDNDKKEVFLYLLTAISIDEDVNRSFKTMRSIISDIGEEPYGEFLKRCLRQLVDEDKNLESLTVLI